MRVEEGEDGRRGEVRPRQPGADEALSPRQPRDGDHGPLEDVVIQLLLQMILRGGVIHCRGSRSSEMNIFHNPLLTEYELMQQVCGAPVHDGVQRPGQGGPRLVVEADDDAGPAQLLRARRAAVGWPRVRQLSPHTDQVARHE